MSTIKGKTFLRKQRCEYEIFLAKPKVVLLRRYGTKQSLSKSNTAPLSSSMSPGMGVGGQSCDTLFTLIRTWLADRGLMAVTFFSFEFSSVLKATQLSTDALWCKAGREVVFIPLIVGSIGTWSLCTFRILLSSNPSGIDDNIMKKQATIANAKPQDKVSTPLFPCWMPYRVKPVKEKTTEMETNKIFRDVF